ncbi:Zinc-type alcohol dehydrogenase-like protein C2E1P3.01 [Termitomyces sp. J132]|nr:Zinc-type alcohol dehydrogenase-like protein C2E1P3.01 [Termitomyces sp. J132]
MAPTQKGLFLDAKFAPFTLKEHSIPKPGPSQLLVRIEATALNPVDWKIQKYGIFIEDYPALIGTDIAGVVEEVGEGTSGFAKGDRVISTIYSHELTDNCEGMSMPLSRDATIPVAAAAAVAGSYLPQPHGAGLTTPFDASGRGKYAGKPVLILGGATSVGQFVIQFAKLSGFSEIIATASVKHEIFLKSLGATHVLDRNLSTAELDAEIRKLTSKPIEFVYDAVSLPGTQTMGYSILANGGTLILVLPSQVKAVEGKNVYTCLGIWTFPFTKDLGEHFYASLTELLETGEIKPNRVEVVPGGLAGIAGSLKRLELNQVSGVKLVVHPQETV